MQDRRLKYIEMPKAFSSKATEIDIACRQSQRACEMLAKHLVKERPKTALEFERVEYLKDFVLKTSKANEKMIELLKYMKEQIQEIAEDASTFENALMHDTLKFQSDTIEQLMQVYDIARDKGAIK